MKTKQESSKNTLVVKDLSHAYTDSQRRVEVLKGINATFEGGTFYAIVGESGSSKTTFLSLLSALDTIQSGDIRYNGESIKKIGAQNFRLKYSNIVFQSFNLIKYMTARENVEVGIDFAGKYRGPSKKEYAYELLDKVGITRQEADRLVQRLSGGQQQRVAIARSMAGDVPIILADEPTGNLDERTEDKVLALFRSLANDGKIVVVVTHSQKVASHADAVVYHMKDGVLTK
ncbi:MAG: ABC transporter ATP-binding protein [Candidatus Saccharimonas sp.]